MDLAVTPTGHGWCLSEYVHRVGDAHFLGNVSEIALAAEDGGVFSFGNAMFHGSA